MTAPPSTLDDLLALVPGLRKLRSLNASMLRVLLDRKRRECTWCGCVIPKYRISWCSDECVTAFRLRCQPVSQRTFVMDRDGGLCQMCGRDVRSAQDAAISEWEQHPSYRAYSFDQHARDEIFKRHGWERGSWNEVDHIIPVVEGGGLLGPENLRLLCGVCHAQVTRELRARMKKA